VALGLAQVIRAHIKRRHAIRKKDNRRDAKATNGKAGTSIRTKAETAAAIKKAARTKKRDVKGGAVHTRAHA